MVESGGVGETHTEPPSVREEQVPSHVRGSSPG